VIGILADHRVDDDLIGNQTLVASLLARLASTFDAVVPKKKVPPEHTVTAQAECVQN
jgi:hypothetical protein